MYGLTEIKQMNKKGGIVIGKKKKKLPLEKEIQKQILAWLRKIGYSVDVISSGLYNRSGIADIVGCTGSGKFFAVEVKRGANKPSALQVKWLEEKRDNGAYVYVANSLASLKEQMKNEMIE